MMDPWLWAVILLTLGILLGVLEVFFPSAGILAFLSAASIVAAIVLGFQQNGYVGLVVLVAAGVGLPAVIILAFKYWPHTAMGRRVLLHGPSSEDVLPDDPAKELLKNLVGKVGKAKSKMLPSGVIVIDGRTISAVSEGAPIEAGQPVRVLQVRGKRVVVQLLDEKEALAAGEDPLSRSFESPFDDPFEERPA
ncbi:MAG: hypothetical protein JXB10_18925 [Pirellulales bacterium]|nr:hypothetical protein [Pirellulales bacterium]